MKVFRDLNIVPGGSRKISVHGDMQFIIFKWRLLHLAIMPGTRKQSADESE